MGSKQGLPLSEQYQRLRHTVLNAQRFLWSDGQQYAGPIRPVGIYLWMSSHFHLLKYWFVLAERVPPEHLNGVWDEESPFGFVTLDLDNNLEFVDWDPAANTFTKIYGSSGNDGTMWGECRYYANNSKTHVSMAVLIFEHGGNLYTGNVTQKLWPS